MGTGIHGGFGNNTKGAKNHSKQSTSSIPLFNNGHITIDSVRENAHLFMKTSVTKIDKLLRNNGYQTQRKPSVHSGSKAKIIITLNPSRERNVLQVQVSPGSKRHGNVPYVKISTSDIGKIKIIDAKKENYKTDGTEKSRLIFKED